MQTLYTQSIQKEQDAEGFLFSLYQQGLAFHPEDSAETIINTKTGKRTFTDREAASINERMSEVFSVMDDPCDYLLGLMCPDSDRED